MKNVLLVQSPPWDNQLPPLGLAYLYSFLKSKRVDAEIFDLNIEIYKTNSVREKEQWRNEAQHWWKNNDVETMYMPRFDKFAEQILSFGAEVIGFSATASSVIFLNCLIRRLKDKSSKETIIVGGPGAFFRESRGSFQNGLVDYFVIGDGEEALFAILNSLEGKNNLHLHPGLDSRTWKDSPSDNAVCIEFPRNMDLDSLPWPDFSKFEIASYTDGTFNLPIMFSKGCTRNCVFCSDSVISSPYRRRSSTNIVNEMRERIRQNSRINSFRLTDIALNADLAFINELCDNIIAAGLNIRWYGQAQIKQDMDESLFLKMKKAGCSQLSLGVESFSSRVLSMMRKGYSSEEASRFLKASKAAGIENNVLLIVGFPGESDADFNDTLEGLKRNAKYIDNIGSLNVCGLPLGADLRNNFDKYGLVYPPGSDWATRDLVNTPKLRKERYETVLNCCVELKIPVQGCLDLKK
jgi:anaerobic magnesium-protoporphyrin IX monomethyl ester cyclase